MSESKRIRKGEKERGQQKEQLEFNAVVTARPD